MSRPLIGITGHLEAAHWGLWVREAVLSPIGYTRAVQRAGGVPVVLPPVPTGAVPRLVAGLDGLVLSGGPDVDPVCYDAPRHEKTDPPDRRRDTFELALTRAALDAGLPVLAISRGMHILNVARGGTLTQHLPDAVGHTGHAPDPVKMTDHDVQVSAVSRIGGILGTAVRVPASHHQAVQRIGGGLLAVGWTSDQVVEAIELAGHRFAVGVQWHPEESDDLRLFEALVAAAERTDPPAGEPSAAGKGPVTVPGVDGPGGPDGGDSRTVGDRVGSPVGAGGDAGTAERGQERRRPAPA